MFVSLYEGYLTNKGILLDEWPIETTFNTCKVINSDGLFHDSED